MEEFIILVDRCDLVVSAVTPALHIAIDLRKKIALFNNVFNKNEFEFYGRGKIIEPDVNCLGCYKLKCKKNCMGKITPQILLDAVEELL